MNKKSKWIMPDEVVGKRESNDISRQFLSNVYGHRLLCMQDEFYLTTEKLGAQSPDWHG